MICTKPENHYLKIKGEMPIRKASKFCKAAIKNHYSMWNRVVILGADGGILPRPCNPCIVRRKNKRQHPAGCCLWRRRWDSNPRDIAVKLISSQVHQGIRLISLYSALRWNVCFLLLRLFLIFWLISFYMLPVAVWATFRQQSFFGQHFLAQHREN